MDLQPLWLAARMRVNGQVRALGTLGVAVGLLCSAVTAASAFNPRVPQVPVLGDALQTHLNDVGQWINVLTDQVDGQVWTASMSPTSAFALGIMAGGAGNASGIYNANRPSAPPLFEVFPDTATVDLYAIVAFTGGILIVTLFDNNSVILGQRTYFGVARSRGYLGSPRRRIRPAIPS